jgi:hypothetical protein
VIKFRENEAERKRMSAEQAAIDHQQAEIDLQRALEARESKVRTRLLLLGVTHDKVMGLVHSMGADDLLNSLLKAFDGSCDFFLR